MSSRHLHHAVRTGIRRFNSQPQSKARAIALALPRQNAFRRTLFWGAAFTLTSACLLQTHVLHLDANPIQPETITDPATSIQFPTSIRTLGKAKSSPLTLLGFGVRTVSFLRVKVYSVAFYADMDNLKLPNNLSPEEKVDYIVRNTSCVVRIVPTRSTSFTHLRDAFMRALQARLTAAMNSGALSEEAAQEVHSPLRKMKSLFPNSPLAKHTPLDIFLSPPTADRQRALVFRDLGAIENSWVATEFVLHYFEGDAPSPALKRSVLAQFETETS